MRRMMIPYLMLAGCLVGGGYHLLQPNKIHADVALTINPTIYDCIKDNGVIARTTTYDSNSKNCDMIVSQGQSTTLQWRQDPSAVFNGSLFAYKIPNDGNSYVAAISGVNQTPGSDAGNGWPSGPQPNFSTMKASTLVHNLTVNINPPI